MALQLVNIGAVPLDGTGDPARTAFGKINSNFAEITKNTIFLSPSSTIINDINNAYVELNALGGGIIQLASGIYDWDGTVTPQDRVAMVGAGMGITRLQMTTTGLPGIRKSGTLSTNTYEYLAFRNFTI